MHYTTTHAQYYMCNLRSVNILYSHAGGLTIDGLKRRTGVSDAQLDTEIIDPDLPILAGCFDNYNDYVDVLGPKAHECADVRRTELLENSHLAAMTQREKC